MNKYIYIFINILAATIGLGLLLFAPSGVVKIFGLGGIIMVAKEVFSGGYKKYVGEKKLVSVPRQDSK